MFLFSFYNLVLYSFLISAAVFAIVLFFIPAPYGRYEKKGWGPQIPSRIGWMIMESPTIWLFLLIFYLRPGSWSWGGLALLIIWMAHYGQRVFMFPFLIRENKGIPLVIAMMAFLFQLANVYLQAGWIYHLAPQGMYDISWLTDIRFLLGTGIFITGYIVNRWADTVLRRLRAQNTENYSIPQGGLYNWISCPNYFGELLIWIGWAVLTWSPAGLAFAIWTAANLIPRAWSHHKWYREAFEQYPEQRKAIIPFLF